MLSGGLIAVPRAVTLTHVGLISRRAGGHVKVGIYHVLGRGFVGLVASSASTGLMAGRMEIPVAATALPAGSYWFMAVYDTTASVGYGTAANALVRQIQLPFADSLPGLLPNSGQSTGEEFNYYLRVTVP